VRTETVPPLAIGLPVRNGEKYLPQALDSLLGQTFGDFTVLISDNASTDATAEIAAEYRRTDPRVRYVRQRDDLGAVGNFNHVFRHTEGEFFKWAAADDVPAPTFLDRCVAELRAEPDAAAAFSAVRHIDAGGVTLGVSQDLRGATDPDPVIRFADFLRYDYTCAVNFGVQRRSRIERTRVMLPFWGSDRVYLAELALAGRYLLIDEPLFAERDHDDKLTTRVARRDIWGFAAASGYGAKFLTWRHGVELLRAVDRARLSGPERRRAYAEVAGWAARNRVKLARSVARGTLATATAPLARRLAKT
jgi:glycosyltransferase involved in cell wall biosynthesis